MIVIIAKMLIALVWKVIDSTLTQGREFAFINKL